MLCDPISELDKVCHRQLLGTLREEGVLLTAEVAKDSFERVAQHLAALTERSLHNLDKELLVAIELLDRVAL